VFTFSQPDDVRKRFGSDFDLMVTELAYDLVLTLHPVAGVAIAGVYGVPNDTFERTADGDLRMSVATIFPSRERGGIYVGLAPTGYLPTEVQLGSDVLEVTLSYQARDGVAEPVTRRVPVVDPGPGDEGLPRGIALVDEATVLAGAATHYHEGKTQMAVGEVAALMGRMHALSDPDLAPEVAMVDALYAILAKETGAVVER
jgi:Ca-activated chloride channel family protein